MNSKKHDLRMYVVIISVVPFVAYLNKNGLVRSCVSNYTSPKDTKKIDLITQLTNYAISKDEKGFKRTEELLKENDATK